MAVAYNSVGTRSSATTGTSVTPALPAAPSAGDLLVALVSVKNNATISTTTAGWVKLGQTNSGASFTVAAFYAIYQSGLSAPAFSWSGSANNQAQVARFTGNLNAYFINPAKSAAATGSTSTHTSNALSSIAGDSLAFLYDLCAAATAFATPTNWSAAFDAGSNVAELSGVTRAGATNATSVTAGAAAWVAQQLEILAPSNYTLPFPTMATRIAAATAADTWARTVPDPQSYYFIGGCQPYDSRNLNPKFENVAVNTPPGGNEFSFVVDESWALPPSPPKLVQGYPAGTNPPGGNEFSFVIDESWTVPPPNNFDALFAIAPPVVSDFVPRALTWLSAVVAAWAPLDAAPVLARNLSPAVPGISVDAPPPSSNALEQLANGGSWPVGWDYPPVKGKLAPGIPGQSVDTPSPSSNGLEQLANGGAWPVGWDYPPVKSKLSPAIPGQSVDTPPPSSNALEQLANAGPQWPLGWDLPLVKGKLSPGLPGQSVDKPPPSSNALEQLANAGPQWPIGWELPLVKGKLAPGIPGQSVDKPPPSSNALEQLANAGPQWPLGWDLPLVKGNLTPGIPGRSVDAPPVTSNALELEIGVSSWPLGWDLPVTAKKFLYGLSVDPPPVSSTALEQLANGGQWPVGWDYPLTKGKLSPGIPGQSVDSPPVNSTTVDQEIVIGAWPVGWTLPVTAGKFLYGLSVDAPPVTNNVRQYSVVYGSIPAVDQPLPILRGNFAAWVQAATVDRPPVNSTALAQEITVGAWPIGWTLPITAGKFLYGLSVDQPPPSSNALEQLANGGVWPVGWDYPPVKGKLSAGIPGQSVDKPPVSSNALDQLAAGGEWPVGWALPVTARNVSPGIPGRSVDAPPGKITQPIFSVDEFILPRATAKIVQPFTAAADNPPFSNPGRIAAQNGIFSAAWAAPDAAPIAGRSIVQPFAATTDNPPFSMRARAEAQALYSGAWTAFGEFPVLRGTATVAPFTRRIPVHPAALFIAGF